MYPRPQKRAHPPSQRSQPSSTYVQAYEAQLVNDQDDLAREVIQRDGRRGLGLIRYAGEVDNEDSGEIWADRHDILHLLPSIPSYSNKQHTLGSPAGSSSSWDSLPSDIEETFYLSDPEEIATYEQEKKKKWIEALRQERLKEREREDEELDKRSDSKWTENEVPPEPILVLMKHTAKAIISSPNPSVLELRILTNHSKDDRFQFLKGRYKSTWDRIKSDLRKEKQGELRKEEKSKQLGLGLGGLGGYDSDTGSDSSENDIPPSPPPPPPEDGFTLSPPPPPPPDDVIPPESPTSLPITEDTQPIEHSPKMATKDQDEEKKRLRRLKMEEWKKKRAMGKAT
ncbi:uncharacterized protein L201_004375 [Kwoniella dendrophila CBS 6074]|uniref:SURP motif domain-containing protein n=1 Tax=Kwoniella dendrophila CBS 6074 TaxID=1295534 RepID=A0AAX4JVZ6_9TREE